MNKSTNNSNGSNRLTSQTATGPMEYLSKLLVGLIVCLLIYAFYLTIETLDRPLNKITIGGQFKYLNHQDLTILVNDEINGGFLTVDLEQLKTVLLQHPWVSQVTIERQWPSQLNIEITEEVPIARWGEKAFLNRLGESLNIADNSHLHKLPLLTAEFGSSTQIMEQYQYLSELLLPTGLKLSQLKLNNLGVWQVETNSGIRLVIGRDNVGEKIKRLVTVWASGLNQQSESIETIDLRYPNGLAVAWRKVKQSSAGNGNRIINGNLIREKQNTTEV